jgi:hypothetical protein
VAGVGVGGRGVKVKFDLLGAVTAVSGKVVLVGDEVLAAGKSVEVGDEVLPAGKSVEVGEVAYCGLQLDRMSKREAIPK